MKANCSEDYGGDEEEGAVRLIETAIAAILVKFQLALLAGRMLRAARRVHIQPRLAGSDKAI